MIFATMIRITITMIAKKNFNLPENHHIEIIANFEMSLDDVYISKE